MNGILSGDKISDNMFESYIELEYTVNQSISIKNYEASSSLWYKYNLTPEEGKIVVVYNGMFTKKPVIYIENDAGKERLSPTDGKILPGSGTEDDPYLLDKDTIDLYLDKEHDDNGYANVLAPYDGTYAIVVDGKLQTINAIANTPLFNTSQINTGSYVGPESGINSGSFIDDNSDEATFIEKAISWFLRIIGSGIYALIGLILGQRVSIDDLIFNNYDNTRLGFFKESGIPAGDFVSIIAEPLNYIFNAFRNIAIVAYLIILIYMAIKVLLQSTAGQRSKFKEIIIYWLEGIAILFLFPYVMKYSIELNDALVQYIEEYKPDIDLGKTPEITGSISDIDFDEQSEKTEDPQNYMDAMKKLSKEKGWLAYTICWLVMVFQVITFVTIYFKRVLITLFLIAIFPLVTIYYALDKIADGDSQAFNHWFKEFLLNIFMQTFHAINYVLVMGIITKIGAMGSASGGSRVNFIIMIFGITYITKGEAILRGIFGQLKGGGAGTVNSAAESAFKATVAINAIRGGISSIKKMKAPFTKAATALNTISMAKLESREKRAELALKAYKTNDEVKNAINGALNSTSDGDDLNTYMNMLRKYANSKDTIERKELKKEIDKFMNKYPAKYKELEEMMRISEAQENFKMREHLTRAEIDESINIILKAKRAGGNKAKLVEDLNEAELRGILAKHKEEIRVLNSVKPQKKKSNVFERAKKGNKKLKPGKGRRVKSPEMEQASARVSDQNKTRVQEQEQKVSEKSQASRSTSQSKKSGTKIENAPDYQRRDNSVSEIRRKVARTRLERLETYSNAEKWLERKYGIIREDNEEEEKTRHTQRTQTYIIRKVATNFEERRAERIVEQASNNILREIREDPKNNYSTRPIDEIASYSIIADSIAKINNADSGEFSYETLWESVSNLQREINNGYELSKQIVAQRKIDIVPFKINLAKEIVNNSSRLSGTPKEKQKILDQAYETLQEAAKQERFDYITEEVQVPIDQLEKGKKPIAKKKKQILTQEEEKTINEILNSEIHTPEPEVDIAHERYVAATELAKGILGVVGGIVGGTIGTAAGLTFSKQGEMLGTTSTMSSTFTSAGQKIGEFPITVVDYLHRGVGYKDENPNPIQQNQMQEKINRAREAGREKRKKIEERLTSRSKRVILTDSKGRIVREETGEDTFGNPIIK